MDDAPITTSRETAGNGCISPDALLPLTMGSATPSPGAAEYLDSPTIRLLVDFFKCKGLAALKEEDRQEGWYQDWIDYQAGHGLYAALLSPKQYSTRGGRFELRNYTRFLETFAYFSPAHAYSLHVSFLGLFPILTGANETLKREAVDRLEAGGLFAFAVSEREHGSDLLGLEFTLRRGGPAGFLASGSKYYIGNANAAGLVSVLGRQTLDGAPIRRSPFVFFVLRPQDRAYTSLRKIRTLGIRTAFVGEFAVADHPVRGEDIFLEGRDAWDAAFGTVDFGKYFLGFGSIGICERAFAEAFRHLSRRVLYGKPVTDMPHIRLALAGAFARLTGMKLFAYRALDYLQAAGPDDRRYLLFNAIQKARVSTEGVKIMGFLLECVGAKGFEADTFFEMALREAPLIPGLEGSTHINYALTAQFIAQYFADGPGGLPTPASATLRTDAPDENPYWMGARDRHPKSVRFGPSLAAFEQLEGANVRVFAEQVATFRATCVGPTAVDFTADAGLTIAVGKCFSVVAYAQLVAENAALAEVPNAVLAVLFQTLIEDLSAEAARLAAYFPSGNCGRDLLRSMVRIPRTSTAEAEAVFQFLQARFVL